MKQIHRKATYTPVSRAQTCCCDFTFTHQCSRTRTRRKEDSRTAGWKEKPKRSKSRERGVDEQRQKQKGRHQAFELLCCHATRSLHDQERSTTAVARSRSLFIVYDLSLSGTVTLVQFQCGMGIVESSRLDHGNQVTRKISCILYIPLYNFSITRSTTLFNIISKSTPSRVTADTDE